MSVEDCFSTIVENRIRGASSGTAGKEIEGKDLDFSSASSLNCNGRTSGKPAAKKINLKIASGPERFPSLIKSAIRRPSTVRLFPSFLSDALRVDAAWISFRSAEAFLRNADFLA